MEDLNLRICRSAHFDSRESANEAFRIPHLFAELRFDLSSIPLEGISKLILPERLVFTCRAGKFSYKERLKAYRLALDLGVHCIDLDFEKDKDLLTDLQSEISKAKTQLILSQHNFLETPNFEKLRLSAQKAFDLSADIVKIITTANQSGDLEQIYPLYEHFDHLVAFAMGEAGSVSRAKILILGAPFTYAAFSDKELTALGQMNFQQTTDLYCKLKKEGI